MAKAEPERRPPSLIAGNIETVVRMEEESLAHRSRGERLVDRVVAIAGSIPFVVLQSVLVGGWIFVNTTWPNLKLDPFPFSLLNLVLAGEALLLTTFVLSKQHRMGRRADRRAHLDLQVNLLSEKEITAALDLLIRLSERMGIDPKRADPSLDELRSATAVDELARDLHEKLPD